MKQCKKQRSILNVTKNAQQQGKWVKFFVLMEENKRGNEIKHETLKYGVLIVIHINRNQLEWSEIFNHHDDH